MRLRSPRPSGQTATGTRERHGRSFTLPQHLNLPVGNSPLGERPHVVLVSPSHTLAAEAISWLSAAGWAVTHATDFATAKTRLQMKPDLIVSELKLGAYNGLHLAVRAQGTPVLILGEDDLVLAEEARRVNAGYLVPPYTEERLLAAVAQVTAGVKRNPHLSGPFLIV